MFLPSLRSSRSLRSSSTPTSRSQHQLAIELSAGLALVEELGKELQGHEDHLVIPKVVGETVYGSAHP